MNVKLFGKSIEILSNYLLLESLVFTLSKCHSLVFGAIEATSLLNILIFIFLLFLYRYYLSSTSICTFPISAQVLEVNWQAKSSDWFSMQIVVTQQYNN